MVCLIPLETHMPHWPVNRVRTLPQHRKGQDQPVKLIRVNEEFQSFSTHRHVSGGAYDFRQFT